MRELLQQALDALKTRWNGGRVDIDGDFHSKQTFDEAAMQLAQEAIEAALSRSKWVKFADALPIVPEGKFSTHIWCWRDGQKGKPYTSNFWAVGFKLSESAATHWMYRQDDTPAPPEDL